MGLPFTILETLMYCFQPIGLFKHPHASHLLNRYFYRDQQGCKWIEKQDLQLI